ncbi:helix-turn-helix transcriptional regulator [Lachnospiraceae bacterium 56-18]
MTIAESNAPFVSGLRIIIAEKGFKNLYVAKKAGFTSQEFSDMLNGRRLIKACDIPKFAKALNVKLDDIYAIGMRGGD